MNNKPLYQNLPKKLTNLLYFFDVSSDVILICDNNLIINYVNLAYTKLTGFKPKEVYGKDYQDFNFDTVSQVLRKKNWDRLIKIKSLTISCKGVRKNGEEYYLDKSIIPITSAKNKNKFTHLIFSGKDTTKEIKSLNNLLKSKRNLLEANKIAKLGFYNFYIKKDYWTSSNELNNIFGIKESYLKNFNSWSQLIHPDYKDFVIKYFSNEVLTKKKKFDIDYKIIDFKTGKEKWVHGLGNLKFDENHQPTEMFGTIQDITEKKELNQKLLFSENALKEAQKIAKIGSWVLDLVNHTLNWSDEIYRIFDTTPQSFGNTYESFLAYVHPEDRELLDKTFTNSIKNKIPYGPLIYRLVMNDGAIKFAEAYGEIDYDLNGEPVRSHGVIQDITKRKEIEQELIASEDKFRSIFHSLNAGMIIVINENGLIIEWNEGAELNFGYTKQELYNKSLSMLMPKRYRKGREKGLANALKNRTLTHKGETFELFGLHKNGYEFPIELTLGSWERDGKLYFSAIIIDVTEQKEGEQHLLQTNSILENIDSIVLLTNIDGEVVYTSPCVKKLIGFEPSEIIGNNWWKETFTAKDESERVKNKLISYLKNNETIRKNNHPRLLKCKDGSLKWFEWHNSRGVDNSIISVGFDISEKKLMEQQLHNTLENLEDLVNARTEELEKTLKKLEISLNKEKELGELKSKFVSTASHQFRTPLTVIQANLGLIKMHIDSLDIEFKKKLDKVTFRIQSEVERMTELMNDVLILGRVNANSIKPNYQLSDIVVVIKDIISKHNEIQLDGRKIENIIKGKPYPLMLDGHLFEHTISNLISNAFKYSKGRPAPILTINFEQKRVIITIKDFGMGIPPQDMKNLFQTFYRASNANDLPGTGLGMAIAKEYAELNGGTITVTSKLDKGSEFIVVLRNR